MLDFFAENSIIMAKGDGNLMYFERQKQYRARLERKGKKKTQDRIR